MKKRLTLLMVGFFNFFSGHAQYWNITGNTGIHPPVEFLGTLKDRALMFKVNNKFSGLIDLEERLNTIFGYESFASQIGGSPGSLNTVIGARALKASTTQNYNTVVGAYAAEKNTSSSNTAIGCYAFTENTSGALNTALGVQSLFGNTTGNGNTAIGFGAYFGVNTFSYSTAVGYLAGITASNQVRIGSNAVTSIGGYAGWSNISDKRVKKNIKENVPGLSFIKQLQPITYNLDVTSIEQFLGTGLKTDDKKLASDHAAAIKAKEQIVYSGFIAQDVEALAKKMSYDFSGVDAAKNDRDLYSLRYADFVVPLVKAVQEIAVLIEVKDAKIDSLQDQINELRSMVLSLTQNINIKKGFMDASLDQNIPNPATSTTKIGYTLPQAFSTAQILITDITGRVLKQINISGTGRGSVNLDTSTLATGTYNYSLIVDNQLISTRKMISGQ